jgi:hypothetical protein
MTIFNINGKPFDATIVHSKNAFSSLLHDVYNLEKYSRDRVPRYVAVNDDLYQVIEKLDELRSVAGILSSLGSGFVKMLFGNMTGAIDAAAGLTKAMKNDLDLRSFLRQESVDEIILRFDFSLKGRNINGYHVLSYEILRLTEGYGG